MGFNLQSAIENLQLPCAALGSTMRLAIISAGTRWHARDLERAAALRGHERAFVDFRRLQAGIGVGPDSLTAYDGVIVRTMPPGSLEQVVFPMDALQRLQRQVVSIVNPP